jgi:HAD superfamily hydrolase (TIGR01459 family)
MIKTKMQTSTPPTLIKGLSEVFEEYDGVILDLWGVLHNGVKAFPDTLPTLAALKKTKKQVWLLSNAPRRTHVITARMEEMGIPSDMYDGLLTSGEACWQALREELIEKWGRRCLHIGSLARDSSVYEGLELEIVQNPDEADFVLNTGIDDFSETVDMYAPLLRNCALRSLPMLCANPDKIVHIGDQLAICAGTLADAYIAMGGEVVNYGKPYPSVYNRCLQAMGTTRVLAVGDSMVTDIAGATGAGLDSALVTSGIHREEFTYNIGDREIEAFLGNYLYKPNYLIQRFSW